MLWPNRYICISGEEPFGGVNMFALLRWLASGPLEAPSSVWTTSLSAPSKLLSVKLIGAAAR